MKFFKSLVAGLVIFGLNVVNLSYAGLFSDTLEDKQLKNIHLCENTKTGVARYSFNLLQTASAIRKSGTRFEASISGDEITLEFGRVEKLEMSLNKIDTGDLKKYNISCYEAQELETPKGEFNRKDKTLNITTITAIRIFGYLQPTEKDKALTKEKRDKANAIYILQRKQALEIKIAKEKEQAETEKAKAEKLAQVSKNKKQIERVAKAKARKALNAKRNRYLKMIDDFEKSSNIHKLKDRKIAKSELILTDKVLDDLVLLLDNLEAEIPQESGYTVKDLRDNIDKLYNLFGIKEKIKSQNNNIYSRSFGGYLSWSENTIEKIKQITK